MTTSSVRVCLALKRTHEETVSTGPGTEQYQVLIRSDSERRRRAPGRPGARGLVRCAAVRGPQSGKGGPDGARPSYTFSGKRRKGRFVSSSDRGSEDWRLLRAFPRAQVGRQTGQNLRQFPPKPGTWGSRPGSGGAGPSLLSPR